MVSTTVSAGQALGTATTGGAVITVVAHTTASAGQASATAATGTATAVGRVPTTVSVEQTRGYVQIGKAFASGNPPIDSEPMTMPSSKLGEARLGSTKFSAPAPFTLDDKPARERAEENIKSTFPTHEGTTWDKLLETILFEFELETETVEKLIDSRFINDATQYQLGMIAEYFGLERRADEDDGEFRARIKTQLPRHTTTTTIDEIVDVTAQLLDTHPQRIDIIEEFDVEPARFAVDVEDIVWERADIDVEMLEALLHDMKAAGVRVTATVNDQFTHRSKADWENGINNESRAYGGYDPATVDWPEDEDDSLTGAYGEKGYTETYYGGVYTHNQHGQITENSELLDVGGVYADEITAGFE